MEYKKQAKVILKALPQNLRDEMSNNNAIIAGGAIVSVFTKREINDYDVYFLKQEDLQKMQTFLNLNKDYKMKYDTINAITYHNVKEDFQIQLIKLMRSKIKALFKMFDFTCCMGAYSVKEKRFYLHKDFLLSNLQQELVFNVKTKYPITSLLRVHKYQEKGFTIRHIELLKIMLCINNLKIKSYEDLRHHLLGIDTMILQPLTDTLIKKNKAYNMNDFLDSMEKYLKDSLEV